MPRKILIVDDDTHIREVVQFALEKAGLETIEAGDGQRALELFSRSKPDLVILDITMPEMDGLAVCREIRKTSDVPILFLSSRADEVDRVVGLEIGGDDYVTKPFSPRELVARVQVILKRAVKSPVTTDVKELSHGFVRLDVRGHAAFWKDKKIQLTATEFAILRTLLRHPERVLSREQLMDAAYDGDISVSDRTIDSPFGACVVNTPKAAARKLSRLFTGSVTSWAHAASRQVEDPTVQAPQYFFGGKSRGSDLTIGRNLLPADL